MKKILLRAMNKKEQMDKREEVGKVRTVDKNLKFQILNSIEKEESEEQVEEENKKKFKSEIH